MYNINNNKNTAFFLTLISPFIGLFFTLSHWRESWAKNAFWLACTFLGAVLIYWPEGTVLGEGSDGGRYVLRLMEMYGSSLSLSGIMSMYMVDQNTMDLYFPIVAYGISRFTDNGHVLFTVFAFVFGYFYSRNIWYVLERCQGIKKGLIVVLIGLFFLVNPITNINGVRYNTAIHIFIYALLPYLWEHDKSKLWWLIAVPLTHFSFMYVVVLVIVYLLIPKNIKTKGNILLVIAMVLFIVSLFINSVNLSSVSHVLEEYSPESYEERIDAYVDQDYLDENLERRSQINWYIGASGIIKNWCYSLLLIFLYPCIKRQQGSKGQLYVFYTFTLFFGAFANFMSLIPSGGRFLIVSQMLIISLILLMFSTISPQDTYRRMLDFSMFLLIIPLITDIRRLFDYYSITAVFGNFVTVFFWENNVSLIDWIKQII